MALSAADLQGYAEDVDWISFNDLSIDDDDEVVESDLAVVADDRLQAAFNAAQAHYLRSAPEGAFAPTRSSRGHTAYVVFQGRERGVFQTW